MVIEDIWFDLKDGRRALICSPREEDVQEILEFQRVTAEETDFLMRYPEECDKTTYEEEKERLAKLNASENEARLVCVVDGKIAGSCQITFYDKIKIRHRANVAIALTSEFWNQGIGTRMFQEMIHIAKKRGGILQMELGFFEGNDRARHLYEKMGFRIVSVQPDAIRLKDGTLLNEYIMMRAME